MGPGLPGFWPGERAELDDWESPVEPDEPDEVDEDELEVLDELEELDEGDDGLGVDDGVEVEVLELADIPAQPLRTSDAPTSRPGSFEMIFMAVPQGIDGRQDPAGSTSAGTPRSLDAFGR